MEEEWRPISGYEGCYEVSSLGRIKNLERMVPHSKGGYQRLRERILKQGKGSHGYLSVILCINANPKTYTVHKLVANAFLGPRPKGMDVDHIDRDRTNNSARNLRHLNRSENCQNNGSHLNPHRYIHKSNMFYVIKKRINGVYTVFSKYFRTREEAIATRDLLEQNNWKKP